MCTGRTPVRRPPIWSLLWQQDESGRDEVGWACIVWYMLVVGGFIVDIGGGVLWCGVMRYGMTGAVQWHGGECDKDLGPSVRGIMTGRYVDSDCSLPTVPCSGLPIPSFSSFFCCAQLLMGTTMGNNTAAPCSSRPPANQSQAAHTREVQYHDTIRQPHAQRE